MNPLLKRILPLLIVPLTVAQAAEKLGFPAFSWDKVPVYQMFADNDRMLTDSEVAQISATSSFICIEKQHGASSLGGADLGTKHEIPRFKALNPAAKCLFYFNSAYAYPFTTHTRIFHYGHVSEKDQRFILKDPKTGELVHRANCYQFDVLELDFRNWWAQTVGKCVHDTGADGLFVDQMHGFAWLRPTKSAEIATAQADLMRVAKQAIGKDKILLLNNGADIPALFEIGDAFMFEHYTPDLLKKEAILKDWELMKKISQAGKISVWRIGVETENPDVAKAGGSPQSMNAFYEELSKKQMPYYLAAFLIGAQPNSYFQYGWGWTLQDGPLVDYPELRKPLGKPLGDFTRSAPNGWIFKREFEHASVLLDLNAREGKIEWK
jgi:hypothetical protein